MPEHEITFATRDGLMRAVCTCGARWARLLRGPAIAINGRESIQDHAQRTGAVLAE